MTEPTEMSFDEAMHAECPYCKEPAMKHRMTDTGNFYCLVPAHQWNYRTLQRVDVARWAIAHANCNELHKSPLSKVKVIGRVLIANLRTSAIPDTVS